MALGASRTCAPYLTSFPYRTSGTGLPRICTSAGPGSNVRAVLSKTISTVVSSIRVTVAWVAWVAWVACDDERGQALPDGARVRGAQRRHRPQPRDVVDLPHLGSAVDRAAGLNVQRSNHPGRDDFVCRQVRHGDS